MALVFAIGKESKMQLNIEQLAALERIQSGGNYFITGKSGAGKTTLIKALAEELQNVIIYPEFIKKEIYHLDEPMKHFVSKG